MSFPVVWSLAKSGSSHDEFDAPEGYMTGHPQDLGQVLVSLVDQLVTDFDFVDLAHSLTQAVIDLVGADAAGVMVVDRSKVLRVIAASDEDTHVLEVFEVQSRQGPCFEAWSNGSALFEADIAAVKRWPLFSQQAANLGYVMTAAVPLRLGGEIFGALNIFWRAGPLPEDFMQSLQALADLAAVGLGQQVALMDPRQLAGQIDRAMRSRVAIEQAKGMLAVQANVNMDQAYSLMTHYGRRHGMFISEIAQRVLERSLSAVDLIRGIDIPPSHE
jgi:transcriptional regulator with GAF, ATPase, and Fis domain